MIHLISKQEISSLFEKRDNDAHKGSFGRILIFAGSPSYPGSAQLVCHGALKSGAGYIYLESEISSETVRTFPEVIPHTFAKPSSIVVGPGLEKFDPFFAFPIPNYQLPMVVDGSGLSEDLLKYCSTFKNLNIIATPHPGEAAHLLACDTESIQRDRPKAIEALSKKFPFVKVWVLKGSGTLIACGGQLIQNTSGSVAMATAGQGDVLSGMLAAFAAQFENTLDAARAAVFIHGFCCDQLSKDRQLDRGVLPHEIANYIPEAVATIKLFSN